MNIHSAATITRNIHWAQPQQVLRVTAPNDSPEELALKDDLEFEFSSDKKKGKRFFS